MSDQIKATAHYPDGSPVTGVGHWTPAGGKPAESATPLEYLGRTEDRATRSAKRAFWHPKRGKPGCHDLEGEALLGATIRIAGEVVERYVREAVTDGAGKVVDLVYKWLDVREEVAEAKRAALLAKVQAEVDGAKPARKAKGGE